MLEAEHVLSVRNELGEGPVWHVGEQALYWTHIEKCLYHRNHPATVAHETVPVGQKVGALAFRASGGFVLAAEHGFALWQPDARKPEPFGKEKQGANPIAPPRTIVTAVLRTTLTARCWTSSRAFPTLSAKDRPAT